MYKDEFVVLMNLNYECNYRNHSVRALLILLPKLRVHFILSRSYGKPADRVFTSLFFQQCIEGYSEAYVAPLSDSPSSSFNDLPHGFRSFWVFWTRDFVLQHPERDARENYA